MNSKSSFREAREAKCFKENGPLVNAAEAQTERELEEVAASGKLPVSLNESDFTTVPGTRDKSRRKIGGINFMPSNFLHEAEGRSPSDRRF